MEKVLTKLDTTDKFPREYGSQLMVPVFRAKLFSMEHKIERQFVEDRTSLMEVLPVSWNVKAPGPYYCITMKMAQLRDLVFGFQFGSVHPREQFSVIELPHRVVKLDLSLNEFRELQADSLKPFENLMELDVSLNTLISVHELGVLPNLAFLNLSYNAIRHVDNFGTCQQLKMLKMSHNRIRTIVNFPMLANLTQLHLDSNKLDSLDGIQNLPKLYELYVQNNKISSLLPLSSSMRLNILDTSNNKIISLTETLHVLHGLRYLTQLSLKGNILAKDTRYTTAIKLNTSVEILDNCLLKEPSEYSLKHHALISHILDKSTEGQRTREGLKDIAKRKFTEELQTKHKDAEASIRYLHGRIIDLQEELAEYEETLTGEMEGCMRYIDAIPQEDFYKIDPNKIPKAMEQHLFTKFWKNWELGKRKPRNLPFNDLKDPEEVLKAAAWLLSNPPSGTSRDGS